MSIREIATLVVVLACGLAVGYVLGRDSAVRDGSSQPAPAQVAATDAASDVAPAQAAAPAPAAPAPEPEVPAEPIYPTVVTAPHQPPPTPALPPEPIDNPSADVAALPDAVKQRLPNTPFSLSGAPFQGNPETAPVGIVVFSDFECQFCARTVPVLEKIRETYGDKLLLAFRHFPLDFHQRAVPAARASWAAFQQGKFWEYHDQLFANQNDLSQSGLERIARNLGLDMDKFRTDMASQEAAAQVEADRTVGRGSQIEGTPTFLINGRKIVGALPFESFKPLIESEISRVETKAKQDNIKIFQARGEVSDINFKRAMQPDDGSLNSLRRVDTKGTYLKGAKDPLVVLMIFSDFECPFCSRLGAVIERALQAYPDEVAVGFRQFPLQIHEHAELAAEAAIFAGEHGKFWEYHDKLFANQQALALDDLVRYAGEVGLDAELMRKALEQRTYQKRVVEDLRLGNIIGVEATPSVFVNGRLKEGAGSFEDLKPLIEAALAQAKQMIASELVPRENFYEAFMEQVPPN